MANETETTVAWLDGFLKAFEWVNHKANHGCRYFVVPLPPGADVLECLSERFKLPPSAFQVEAMPAFDRELRVVFADSLFLFQDPWSAHLVDQRNFFTLTHDWGRELLLDELISMIRSLGVVAVWRVIPSAECAELRDCSRTDVVLEWPDGRCLLHFGVSD